MAYFPVKTESLVYAPGLQDSGDLEPATRTITATAKQATPDYTANLTLPAPGDSRLAVQRLGLRLQLTIDSFGGTPAATRLSYSVEVNGVERLTGNFTTTGAGYAAVDLTSGQFSLGPANTISVFLWVDQGQVLVSLAQLWLGVGTASTSQVEVLRLTHRGWVHMSHDAARIGTGTLALRVYRDGLVFYRWLHTQSGGGVYGDEVSSPWLVPTELRVAMYGTQATDLNILHGVEFVLRSP